jgi:hypothetical protein
MDKSRCWASPIWRRSSVIMCAEARVEQRYHDPMLALFADVRWGIVRDLSCVDFISVGMLVGHETFKSLWIEW